MKNLLIDAVFICVICLSVPGYAQNTVIDNEQIQKGQGLVMDRQASAKAPWKVGDVVAKGVVTGETDQNGEEEKVYRKFLGVTSQGYFLVQSFFVSDDVKLTDVYQLLDSGDVTNTLFSDHARGVEGEYIQWYHNGAQHTHNRYHKGKLNGPQTIWYNNGKTMLEVTYNDGLAQGLATVWDNDGFKISEITYQNNKIAELKNFAYGQFQIAHYVMAEDGISSQVTYQYKDGQKESEGSMRNEFKQGVWTFWYENGKMKEQGEFRDDERVGLWKYWGEDGTLKEEKNHSP